MGGASLEQTRFHHKMAVCLIHVLYEKGEIPRSVYKEAASLTNLQEQIILCIGGD